jgi:hypothetical protein
MDSITRAPTRATAAAKAPPGAAHPSSATPSAPLPLSSRQAMIILEAIAGKAQVITSLCIAAIMEDGVTQEASDFMDAARELASQAGLLADHGALLLGGIGLKGANIEGWLLPPVYRELDNSGEQP